MNCNNCKKAFLGALGFNTCPHCNARTFYVTPQIRKLFKELDSHDHTPYVKQLIMLIKKEIKL